MNEAILLEEPLTRPKSVSLNQIPFACHIIWFFGLSPSPFRIKRTLFLIVADYLPLIIVLFEVSFLYYTHFQNGKIFSTVSGVVGLLYLPLDVIAILYANWLLRRGEFDRIIAGSSTSKRNPFIKKTVIFSTIFAILMSLFMLTADIVISFIVSGDIMKNPSIQYAMQSGYGLGYMIWTMWSSFVSLLIWWLAVAIYISVTVIIGHCLLGEMSDYVQQAWSIPNLYTMYLFVHRELQRISEKLSIFVTLSTCFSGAITVGLAVVFFFSSLQVAGLPPYIILSGLYTSLLLAPAAYLNAYCDRVHQKVLISLHSTRIDFNHATMDYLLQDDLVLRQIDGSVELTELLTSLPLCFQLYGVTIRPSLLIKVMSALTSLVVIMVKIRDV